jgi:malate dehydrogenase (oxaloacetate-decarboxylating)(NADP+)
VTGGRLTEQTILFQGAGEAATGIANLTVSAMVAQGLSLEAARHRCWLVDSRGLVTAARSELAHHKQPFAHEHAPVADLLGAVRALRPSAIIGVAAVGGAFTDEVLAEMGRINERPIVFALSNPTSKSECTALAAYTATKGRALFACGSPFDPVTLGGKTLVPRQGNNSYIFPGVGLAAIVTRTSRITDEMFMAAARTLARPRGRRRPCAGQPVPRVVAGPRGFRAHRHGRRRDRLRKAARRRARTARPRRRSCVRTCTSRNTQAMSRGE